MIAHPFGLQTRAQVRAIAENCVHDIARIATDPQAGTPAGGKASRSSIAARAARVEAPEEVEDFDRFCVDRRWSDGLPLRPPTQDSIKPEEVSIIVAGGPGTHSVHVPTFGHTRSVTRKIV